MPHVANDSVSVTSVFASSIFNFASSFSIRSINAGCLLLSYARHECCCPGIGEGEDWQALAYA